MHGIVYFCPKETDSTTGLTKKYNTLSLLAFLVLLLLPSVAFSRRNQVRDNPYSRYYSVADSLLPDTLKRHDLGKRIDQEKEKKRASLGTDSTTVGADSLTNDSTKSEVGLDAPVTYTANDSIVFENGGFAHLFGEGNVTYDKVKLEAAVISMNMDSSSVYAHGVKDEAVSALTMLGFSPAPSAKVVVDILKAQPDLPVEQVVKLALKQIK